jgi:3-mercaptopyruvate sulfurtransferase SseA
MIQIISLTQLRQRLDANPGLFLFEALPARYFDAGHIPGARQLSHTAPTPQIAALGIAPDHEIILYCSNEACRNSHVAAHHLTVLGHTHVSVFSGGKQAWSGAGLPLVPTAAAA